MLIRGQEGVFSPQILSAPHKDIADFLTSTVDELGPVRVQALYDEIGAMTTGGAASRSDTITAIGTLQGWNSKPELLEQWLANIEPGTKEQFIRAAGALLTYWGENSIGFKRALDKLSKGILGTNTFQTSRVIPTDSTRFRIANVSGLGKTRVVVGDRPWLQGSVTTPAVLYIEWTDPDNRKCKDCPLLKRGVKTNPGNTRLLCSQQELNPELRQSTRKVWIRVAGRGMDTWEIDLARAKQTASCMRESGVDPKDLARKALDFQRNKR